MTSPDPVGRYEVPVSRLAGGRRNRQGAAAVAATVIAVIATAFGIARLSERASTAPSASARIAAASASVLATSSPAASARPTGARVENLLPVGRVALPGSPEVTLVDVTGADQRDLGIIVWTPDDGRMRTIRTIPDVLPDGLSGSAYPVLAPDRRHALIFHPSGRGEPGSDTGRLIDDRGALLWRGEGLSAASGALWSADSRLVVIAGQPRQWHLLGLDRPGHVQERTVTLPDDVYLPKPVPPGSIGGPWIEPRTVPLGFSADGRWIYGGVISPRLAILLGQFRVSSDGATVERLLDFRVGQPDGLVPRPGTLGSQTVDATTGRVATSRVNSDTTGGPRTVEVRGPDAAFLFTVDGGVTLGAEWGGHGNLYALTADTVPFASAIELHRIDAQGDAGPPLLTTGPLTAGALIGVRDGYAILFLVATRPTLAAQLVAVDLAHPERVTALPVGPEMQLIGGSVDR